MNLSGEVNRILFLAKEEAIRLGNEQIMPDHLFLGILREGHNRAFQILEDERIDLIKLKEQLDSSMMSSSPSAFSEGANIPVSVDVQRILSDMISEARREGAENADSFHLLSAILAKSSATCTAILSQSKGLDYKTLTGRHSKKQTGTQSQDEGRTAKKSLLLEFGKDLTAQAMAGKLDPVIGREAEIDRIARVLGRRRKNNPLLTGESGVGKSAIVEGLACRIVRHRVPSQLINKKIISLDMASVVAGTKFRGEFEQRMSEIVDEISGRDDIILFIDEVHSLVGAGNASGSIDAADILKPALSRGKIQCIGTTTNEEYRKIISKDSSLERRFQRIDIRETDYAQTMCILKGIRDRYEQHHHVRYTDDALKACIELTQRYVSGRCFPDKAIDALDEAGAARNSASCSPSPKLQRMFERLEHIGQDKRAAAREEDFVSAAALFRRENTLKEQISRMTSGQTDAQEFPFVDAADIAKTVSEMTGIPVEKVSQGDATKLLSLERVLSEEVIGQQQAVRCVVKAIKRGRSGIKDPNRPIGTFLFFGPTGVGKTQLAKAIAKHLFDSQDNLIRINMGEFGDKFTATRLIGAPPGYVGHENGGELCEKVALHPYSVVLFDEIEKAHPDIFNLLLQVMDEGRLTDSNGRSIDFRNTIIIMTSNVGSRELSEYGKGLGYTNSLGKGNESARQSIIDKSVNALFPPEFLNRIDARIYFRSLDEDDMLNITTLELDRLRTRLKCMGYGINIPKNVISFIASEGYDPKFGARPLKRAVQTLVEDPLADLLIAQSADATGKTRKTIRLRLSGKEGNKKIEMHFQCNE